MKSLFSFLISFYILIPVVSKGDSPVTSTPFYSAYQNIPEIMEAGRTGILTKELAGFLFNSNKPIDEKMALINALSWGIDGKHNADSFKKFIYEKHNWVAGTPLIKANLSGDELLCFGYLLLLDDYFHPLNAIPWIEEAVKQNPKSFTFNIILAIAYAQYEMDYNWCKVWKVGEKVFESKSLKKDMKDEAVKAIREYLELYKESC